MGTLEMNHSFASKARIMPQYQDYKDTLRKEEEDDEADDNFDDDDDDEGDMENSGMHTNDKFNSFDSQGRVLVNLGHPPEDPDIFLPPQIAAAVKPHQVGGIRFLYDNLIESLEQF